MGYPRAPGLTRRVGYHRPQISIGGPLGQTTYQRPGPGRGTVEGANQEVRRPGQTTDPRQRSTHPRHQLAIRRPKAQKTRTLNVEKHLGLLVEHETGIHQIEPDKRSGDPSSTNLRQSIGPKHKWHTFGFRRHEGRERVRKPRLHESQRPVVQRGERLEKPSEARNELSQKQQEEQGGHR